MSSSELIVVILTLGCHTEKKNCLRLKNCLIWSRLQQWQAAQWYGQLLDLCDVYKEIKRNSKDEFTRAIKILFVI